MNTITAPETCIPDMNVSFDLNRDWPCKRAEFIYHLHVFADDINRTAARAERAVRPYVRRNLDAWVADAIARFERLLPHLADKVCTCRESGLYGN